MREREREKKAAYEGQLLCGFQHQSIFICAYNLKCWVQNKLIVQCTDLLFKIFIQFRFFLNTTKLAFKSESSMLLSIE